MKRAPAAKARSLDDLGQLKAALRSAREEAAARVAAERAREAESRRERELFTRTVGTVVPLRKVAPNVVPRPRPPAVAQQRKRDEEAVLAESISDEFDVETLLDTDDALSFRRPGIGVEVLRKLRRGVWALQGEIDLHGMRRDEAREALGAFLREAASNGARCVRIVHGKGHGSPGREPVLKAKVKTWLVQRKEVLAFVHARAADGGHGALIVLLQPSRAGGAAGHD